jgi:hypothetical protein
VPHAAMSSERMEDRDLTRPERTVAAVDRLSAVLRLLLAGPRGRLPEVTSRDRRGIDRMYHAAEQHYVNATEKLRSPDGRTQPH